MRCLATSRYQSRTRSSALRGSAWSKARSARSCRRASSARNICLRTACWTWSSTGGSFATLWAGRSEEHTSELQSLMRISYAVFCLKKKKKQYDNCYTLILFMHDNNLNITILYKVPHTLVTSTQYTVQTDHY